MVTVPLKYPCHASTEGGGIDGMGVGRGNAAAAGGGVALQSPSQPVKPWGKHDANKDAGDREQARVETTTGSALAPRYPTIGNTREAKQRFHRVQLPIGKLSRLSQASSVEVPRQAQSHVTGSWRRQQVNLAGPRAGLTARSGQGQVTFGFQSMRMPVGFRFQIQACATYQFSVGLMTVSAMP